MCFIKKDFVLFSHNFMLACIPSFLKKYNIVRAQLLSHTQLFSTPWTVACQVLLSWDFSEKNTGVGCHFLLRGIFLTSSIKFERQDFQFSTCDNGPQPISG